MEKEIILLVEEAPEGGKMGRGKYRMCPDREGGAASVAALAGQYLTMKIRSHAVLGAS